MTQPTDRRPRSSHWGRYHHRTARCVSRHTAWRAHAGSVAQRYGWSAASHSGSMCCNPLHPWRRHERSRSSIRPDSTSFPASRISRSWRTAWRHSASCNWRPGWKGTDIRAPYTIVSGPAHRPRSWEMPTPWWRPIRTWWAFPPRPRASWMPSRSPPASRRNALGSRSCSATSMYPRSAHLCSGTSRRSTTCASARARARCWTWPRAGTRGRSPTCAFATASASSRTRGAIASSTSTTCLSLLTRSSPVSPAVTTCRCFPTSSGMAQPWSPHAAALTPARSATARCSSASTRRTPPSTSMST